ncbi:DM13 domain-containing protein [Rhizobium sp. WYCCWR 11152]|uniref:DM13 domain-containing protein n=1 Tax=Rhizobium sp. WYCCWR 11152 TaxID=2692316 RepID=UPI0014931CDA|nr:DM13 domain-containing protein [Rhizobium sp. WYCCWR 11152]NNU63777.1 DM13 domain-containing protein [Rhizobium sp. WYCCWR 11152]
MGRWLILITTHLVMLAIGFAGGIYTLPVLTAPRGPDTAALQMIATETLYVGALVRNLKGSDLLHWGEGEVRVSRNRIAHLGRLAPGPDYKLYLAPRFVDTKEAFLLVKDKSVRVGDVKTFNGFIVEMPAGIDVRDYNTVVIWCEAFDQFISGAEYQPSRQDRK